MTTNIKGSRARNVLSLFATIPLIWGLNAHVHQNHTNYGPFTDSQLCHVNFSSFNTSCLSAYVSLPVFEESSLSEVLTSIHHFNESVRQVSILLHDFQPTTDSISTINKVLDHFLSYSLWWSVTREPYLWLHEKPIIVLSRYHRHYEPYLRLISSIQYPDATTCDKAVLFVGRETAVHPGWGSVLMWMHNSHRAFWYSIRAQYNSRSNHLSDNEQDNTAFIHADECSTTVNKWECAFLSMTNCTLPTIITQCTTDLCVFKLQAQDGLGLRFDHANGNGVLMTAVSNHELNTFTEKITRTPLNDMQYALSNNNTINYKLPMFAHLIQYNYDKITNKLPLRSTEHQAPEMLYENKFILRPNYVFRSKINQLIANFYKKNDVLPGTRCVAAQVRRGDRIVAGVNMTEFCINATRPITADNPMNWCQSHTGLLDHCEGLYRDKGCEGIPFGAVTLESIILKGEQLVSPEVRNLFVFTDDVAWLERERILMKIKYPHWRVHSFDPPILAANVTVDTFDDTISHGYSTMRSQAGSASGAYFLGTLQLAQQCEAFVAHFGSEVPVRIQYAMCVQHGVEQKQGTCPPTYDLRSGL